jgi:hypothetical protein
MLFGLPDVHIMQLRLHVGVRNKSYHNLGTACVIVEDA